MRLVNYKRAWDHEIYEWLEKSIPELTVYQKEAIRDNEIIRFAKFYFVKKIEPVKNIFVRLSVFLIPIAWICIVLSLPVNFLINGKWGYSNLEWFGKWLVSCNL